MRLKLPIKVNRRMMGGMVAVLASCGVITCAFVVGPALAAPDGLSSKQAEADRIKAEIASINASAEQSIEQYNQANVELDATRQRLAENEKALSDATAKLAQAQDRLNRRIANIYRGGSLSIMDVILSTSDFSDFMARFDLLGKISDQDRSTVEAVLQYKTEVEKTQAELASARQKQEELLASLASEKADIESQLAARQKILSGVEGEIAQMVAQDEQEQWQTAAASGPAPAAPSGGAGESNSSSGGQQTGNNNDSQPAPAPAPPPPSNGNVVAIARQYLGIPYVWGGASPAGFDCSGLVMYVYAQVGIYLPHSAAAQYYSGTPISYSELAPGDLVFFGHPISHVGIYIGGGQMIHAPFEGSVVSIASVGGGGSYAGACRL